MKPRRITFDKQVWITREVQRLARVIVKRGLPQASTWAAHSSVLLAIEGIDKVVRWCNKRSIKVFFGGRVRGKNQENGILVSRMQTPERQLHVLLHECGHKLIDVSKGKSKFEMGWSIVYESPMPSSSLQDRFHHKHDIVAEEIEAWERGLALARRLGVYLDSGSFTKTRMLCVKTYFKWAVQRKRLV